MMRLLSFIKTKECDVLSMYVCFILFNIGTTGFSRTLVLGTPAACGNVVQFQQLLILKFSNL